MTAQLPTHPTMRHPLTGDPLHALWVRPDGRICWPILGGSEPAPEPPAPGNEPEPEPADDLSKAKGEAKKWRGRAESNYDILRKLGITKPEDAQPILERLQRQEALEDELSTEKDKAVKEARKAARGEADSHYRPLLADTAFRVAIGDRKPQNEVDEFLADLNLSRFLTEDGRVDTVKVLARVEQFAPAQKGTQPGKGPIIHGLTPGGGTPAQPGEQGRLMAEKRFGKK